MSERNIEQMMEMLRESGEERPDFERKSQEIINNFKDKKIQQFLAVFCLATQSPPKKRMFQKKSDNPVAKVLRFANESLDQSEILWI